MKRCIVVALGAAVGAMFGAGNGIAASPYAGYANGPPTDPNFFPIGVWYQNLQTSIINGYAAMGINVYDYPASGMTASLLTTMKNDGMYAVIPQDSFGLSQVNNKTIIGWFNNPDEPDNAQANGSGGYGDPVNPATIIAQYNTMKAADATRPILLNLGQAVAWPDDKTNGSDSYYGRGSRSDHPQDYGYNSTYTWTNGVTYTGGYTAGSDIALFDFYPTNSTDAAVANKLNLVGQGVTRLINWSPPGHPVWNWIETTDITVGDSAPGPTPTQTKAEVWDSLVHGSMGIMYFAHQFPEPPQSSHELLDDPVMNPAVTAIDAQIKSLAPELNSATLASGTLTTTSSSTVHLDYMTKSVAGNGYLFTVANQTSAGPVLFKDASLAGVNGTVTVVGENRTLPLINGKFADSYANNTVHLYELVGHSTFTPTVSTSLLMGDANMDGVVNAIDLGILATNFNSTTANWSTGDFDGSGGVNAVDLGILATNFNATSGGGSFEEDLTDFPSLEAAFSDPSGVPEPASLGLLALGMGVLLGRSRRGVKR